jgi:hypothetical protein
MKNSSDTIGNRTRDLPACSAVPQPTVPPRASIGGIRVTFKCTHKDGQVAIYIQLQEPLCHLNPATKTRSETLKCD